SSRGSGRAKTIRLASVCSPRSAISSVATPSRRTMSEIEPVTIVIFGGAGDLAHRKLLPALYNLRVDGLLPPRVAVVGVGRKAIADEEYRRFAKDGITQFSRRPLDEQAWDAFAPSLFYVKAPL